MLLETFYKDRIKTLCTGVHKIILIHYALWSELRVSEFSCIYIAQNIMKFTYFFHGQKHVNCRIWNELHAWFIYRVTQNNSYMWVTMARNCRNFISCYFMQFSNKLDIKTLYDTLEITSKYRAIQNWANLFFSKWGFVLIFLNILM